MEGLEGLNDLKKHAEAMGKTVEELLTFKRSLIRIAEIVGNTSLSPHDLVDDVMLLAQKVYPTLHWCADWDFMPVRKGQIEWGDGEWCVCGHKPEKGEEEDHVPYLIRLSGKLRSKNRELHERITQLEEQNRELQGRITYLERKLNG